MAVSVRINCEQCSADSFKRRAFVNFIHFWLYFQLTIQIFRKHFIRFLSSKTIICVLKHNFRFKCPAIIFYASSYDLDIRTTHCKAENSKYPTMISVVSKNEQYSNFLVVKKTNFMTNIKHDRHGGYTWCHIITIVFINVTELELSN